MKPRRLEKRGAQGRGASLVSDLWRDKPRKVIVRQPGEKRQPPRNSLFIPLAFSGAIQSVRLGSHDEIVAMQALDLMRPPGDRHLTPLGQ